MKADLQLPGLNAVVRDMEPRDEQAVLTLFDACEDWFTAATGQPAGPGDVQSLYYSLPEGADFDDKRLLVVADGARVVGLVDAVLRHPAAGACSVGVFLLHPGCRRQGLGRALAGLLLEEARGQGVSSVVATVTEGWRPGREFLTAMGFILDEQPRVPGGNRNRGPSERAVTVARLSL
jgi:GNAT superfamily N-acetyltransferase